MLCVLVPLNDIVVPAAMLRSPLLMRSALRSSVPVPSMASTAPVSTVRFCANAPGVEISGEKGVPETINTSIVDVGTPPHQLVALFQSLSAVPTHWPPGVTVIVALPVRSAGIEAQLSSWRVADRKSTRLNSSHGYTPDAV